MEGRFCRLEPLDPAAHAGALHAAWVGDDDGWRFMGYGPFADAASCRGWAEGQAGHDDPQVFAILDAAGPAGVAAFLAIRPEHGVIEIGHIRLATRLQRTAAATEALALMLRRVFDALGYRRCEWKCDADNIASRRAALRLGFAFEGVFRQHMVVKGRNRDTAWFSLLDADWPRVRAALDAWLAETGDGPQRRRLSDLTAPGAAPDPAGLRPR
jgi:RimJ/RimL family protein N-acetyltransferase